MSLARTRRYRQLIDAAAATCRLPAWTYRAHVFEPGVWLEGLVLTESGGDPTARRYEPHQDRADRRDASTDPDTPAQDDGAHEDDASYGLMQVMGYNIRKLDQVPEGTRIDFSKAYLPIQGISYGMRMLLHELKETKGNVARALARYNGGPTGDDGVPMRRQVYVDKVFEHSAAVQADRTRG